MIDSVGMNDFLTIFVLTFALFLLVAGIFTAYFGSGKSRMIGGGLLGFGVVLGLVWILICSTFIFEDPIINVSIKTVIIQSVLVIVAAVIGALAAIGMFLAAIMKA